MYGRPKEAKPPDETCIRRQTRDAVFEAKRDTIRLAQTSNLSILNHISLMTHRTSQPIPKSAHQHPSPQTSPFQHTILPIAVRPKPANPSPYPSPIPRLSKTEPCLSSETPLPRTSSSRPKCHDDMKQIRNILCESSHGSRMVGILKSR